MKTHKSAIGFFIFGFCVLGTSHAEDIFVRWESQKSTFQKEKVYLSLGLKKLWTSQLVPGLERLEILKAGNQDFVLKSLRSLAGVKYAEPNYKQHRKLAPMISLPADLMSVSEDGIPNDPLYSKQWALNTSNGINLEEAWAITKGSKDIKVAVIDTGVDPNHEELSDRLAPGFDFIDNTAVVTDHHGHGSHVSGIIGAKTNNSKGIAGINQEVTIIPIRAVPSDADETDANVIQSFEFAVQAGARVANCSFGKYQESQAVADAITAAGEHGLLVVVASGNDGADINVSPAYPAAFHTSNMIVVASSKSDGGLSYFSNFGMGLVDLAAPGSNIYSSIINGGYASWSGTSMATPQVVGVAALVLAANPGLSVSELKQILEANVTKVSEFSNKMNTGGRINAGASVKAAHDALR